MISNENAILVSLILPDPIQMVYKVFNQLKICKFSAVG